MLTRRFEVCAYRHCNNEFRTKREAQRFCSKRCRDAWRYDVKRAEKGVKKARKRRLGAGILGSAEKAPKRSRKAIPYKEWVDPSIALQPHHPVVDLIGVKPELLRKVIEIECDGKGIRRQ